MRTLRSVVGACALAAALPVLAHAQSHATDRGSMLVAGQASFSSSASSSGSGASSRTTRLAVAPRVQYFVLPGLAVGGDASVSRERYGDAVTTTYGAGPMVSYYFGGAERAWYPYLSARVGMYRHTYGDGTPPESSRGYAASGGAVLMLSRAVGLDAALTYEWSPGDSAPDFKVLSFGVGVSAFVF